VVLSNSVSFLDNPVAGSRPDSRSGGVRGAPGEVWTTIDNTLKSGRRGLAGGSSPTRLLDEYRLERCRALTVESILAWADSHHAATGRWPNSESGAVLDAPGELWRTINSALSLGVRGLPAGSSLARLLREKRRGLSRTRSRELTLEQVLAWGEAHRAATGDWPDRDSGPIPGAPGETWAKVRTNLLLGNRGLPAGTSLAKLFAGRATPSTHEPTG